MHFLFQMVEYIISYLTLDDIKQFRLTCPQFERLSINAFVDRSNLRLNYEDGFRMSSIKSKHKWIFKTKLQFKAIVFIAIKFSEADPNDVISLFDKFGMSWTDVNIHFCQINKKLLYKVLNRLKVVKRFCFNNRVGCDYSKIVSILYPTIEILAFDNISPLDTFMTSIDKIPTDIELKITELRVPFVMMEHYTGYYSFSESGVYALLKRIVKTLKILTLFNTKSYKDVLPLINELHLNLDELTCGLEDNVFNEDFNNLCSSMKDLKKFGVTGEGLNDDRARIVTTTMKNLRNLRLYENDVLSNDGFQQISKFKQLEKVLVYNCKNISNKGISAGIASKPNLTLTCFKLHGNYCDETLIAIVTNLPNLNHLHLATNLYFTADLIPLVYERLPKLRHFSLSSLNSSTDNLEWEPHLVLNECTTPTRTTNDGRISMLKDLEIVRLSGYAEVPGASLNDLCELINMTDLTLQHYNTVCFI